MLASSVRPCKPFQATATSRHSLACNPSKCIARRSPCAVASASNKAQATAPSANPPNNAQAIAGALAASALSLALLAGGPAIAADKHKIGEFAASGLLFKDTVEVTALDDPEVPGVTIYFSDFKRSLVDKLSKDFFSEPSQASLSCAITGPLTVSEAKLASGGQEGREMFRESKGLNLFKDKTLRVRRMYDPHRKTLLYVAYSTRLTSAADEKQVTAGRYRSSICALKLPEAPPLAATPSAAAAPAVAPAAPTAAAAAAPTPAQPAAAKHI